LKGEPALRPRPYCAVVQTEYPREPRFWISATSSPSARTKPARWLGANDASPSVDLSWLPNIRLSTTSSEMKWGV